MLGDGKGRARDAVLPFPALYGRTSQREQGARFGRARWPEGGRGSVPGQGGQPTFGVRTVEAHAALGKAAGGGHGRLNCLSLPKPVSRERGRWAQGISA